MTHDEVKLLLHDMRMEAIYTDKVSMPIPLYERIKAVLSHPAPLPDSTSSMAQAMYEGEPESDGLARYSRDRKVSPDLSWERLSPSSKAKWISRAERALAAIASTPDSAWQPIETAPKDGMLIIGCELNTYGKWRRYITHFTATVPWSEQWLFDHDEETEYCPAGWFTDTSDDEIVTSCHPTHWMPLPKPPIASPTGRG